MQMRFYPLRNGPFQPARTFSICEELPLLLRGRGHDQVTALVAVALIRQINLL